MPIMYNRKLHYRLAITSRARCLFGLCDRVIVNWQSAFIQQLTNGVRVRVIMPWQAVPARALGSIDTWGRVKSLVAIVAHAG